MQACPKYLWVTWNEYKLKLSCYMSEYVKVVNKTSKLLNMFCPSWQMGALVWMKNSYTPSSSTSRVWQKWAIEILFPPLVPSCTLWGLMSTCGLLSLYIQPPPPSLHLFWPKHVHTGNKCIPCDTRSSLREQTQEIDPGWLCKCV